MFALSGQNEHVFSTSASTQVGFNPTTGHTSTQNWGGITSSLNSSGAAGYANAQSSNNNGF